MHSRTVEQVRTWDSRPFSGGLGTLYELSESDHTGAVVAEDTWLFMLNGRVIGIFEGTMDDFEASGTVYTTPHDSLPLLFAMQERDGQTRAKYFTEDTPLKEADQTLADANFTGYVELSENVLSGDYYLVYYGGTRRSVAFIGQSERVETGEAAFERAAEEVGLYEVMDVSMTITEIPEPRGESTAVDESDDDAAETDDSTVASGDEARAETRQASEPTGTSAAGASNTDETLEPASREPASSEPGTGDKDPGSGPGETEVSAGVAEGVEHTDPEMASGSATDGSDSTTASTADTNVSPGGSETGHTSDDSAVGEQEGGNEAAAVGEGSTESGETSEWAGAGDSTGGRQEETDAGEGEQPTDTDSKLERMFRAEEQWRRSKAIPALDPDDTESTEESGSETPSGPTEVERSPSQRPGRQARTATSSEPTAVTERDSGSAGNTVESRATADRVATASERGSGEATPTARERVEAEIEKRDARIEDLQDRLTAIEREREQLDGELEDERAERSRLESELSRVRSERDELASRVEELEATLESEGSSAEPGKTALSPSDALSGTNLFVRYDSKSDPTLEALGSDVDPNAVNANLTLEHHTQFETSEVQVEGQSYREFLEGTGEFRFVSWVLRELPYELLETGNRNSLGDLFEAISEIDRVEFDGRVTVDPESGGDRQFALVMRDRMGNPLVLGEYSDDRNPVRDEELETLLDGARDVAAAIESLAGVFYVTASFFEPAALERAENAASSGGLFSRQEKASFVTPDSGTGFHLGLVEDRSQAFHVTVPKL
ncbi:MAG: hypothetical protein ABEJ84_08360 [Halodesulfurarchaeum sp.]